MGISGVRTEADIVQRFRELRAGGYTQAEAARVLGISGSTASKYDNIPDGPAAAEPPADPIAEAVERAAESRKARIDARSLKEVAGELSFRSFVQELLEGAIEALPAPQKHTPFRPPAKETTSESLVVVLSDWHAYETVRPERVLGLNEYTAEVFGRRAWNIKEKTLSIRHKLERGGWRFGEIVVVLAGDFLSGSIHEVERHSDAPNVAQAAVACSRVLAYVLRDLHAEFDSMRVVGVGGNHGRFADARRMQQKDPTRNWDWLVYQMAKMQLEGCPGVEWNIPDSYFALFDVQGWKFIANHGHEIKSSLGTPHYGMARNKRNIRDALHNHPERPDYFIYGHFHEPGAIEDYILNGCLCGTQEFGLNCLGKVTEPYQWLLGVHAEHGISHQWKLHAGRGLDGPGYPCTPWLDK